MTFCEESQKKKKERSKVLRGMKSFEEINHERIKYS